MPVRCHAAALCLALALLGWAQVHPAAVLAAPERAPAPPFTGVVNDGANLRSGPGATYDRVGGAAAGQTVQVVACNDACDWYKLETGAWIAAFLVTPAASTSPAAAPTQTVSNQATPIADRPTANNAANLRAGPGTSYERTGSVAAGAPLEITGRSEAGDWYQLASGSWIAGFLVTGAPGDLPVANAPAASAPAVVETAPAAPPVQSGAANIVIQWVNYDGGVYRVESDEFAVIANQGSAPASLRGWRLNAGDNGQDFGFPDYMLNPGAFCRVYTNEYHPDTCGFSFGRGQAIWNNKGDCGYLFDSAGNQVDSYCY